MEAQRSDMSKVPQLVRTQLGFHPRSVLGGEVHTTHHWTEQAYKKISNKRQNKLPLSESATLKLHQKCALSESQAQLSQLPPNPTRATL